MKGCGKSLVVYFMGVLSGFIFFFGAIFGTLYAAVAAVKVGTIAEKAGDNVNAYVEGKPVADMTILGIVKGLIADFKSEDGLSIGKLNDDYGVDIVGILEGALGITLDDRDVLVKVSDVDAYVEGETKKITRYAYNAEGDTVSISASAVGKRYTEAAEGEFVQENGQYIAYDAANPSHQSMTRYNAEDIVETLPIGNYFRVTTTDGKKVFSYLDAEDTWQPCTTRYDIVNDKYGANEAGAYYFVRGGTRSSFADFSLANISEMTGQLLNIFTLSSIGSLAGITFPDMALINDYMTLPVQQALQSIMDLVDGIENKTINELDELLGLNLSSQDIFKALGKYSLSTMDNAINELTLGELVSVDRDVFVKSADLAAYKANPALTLNAYISRYDDSANDITANGTVEFSDTTYKVEGGILYEMVDGSWVACEEAKLYKLEEEGASGSEGTGTETSKKLVVAEEGYVGETYIKIHKGEGILNSLADASIGTIQDSIGSIKLGDVMDIYEDDVYEESATGDYVRIGENYVAYDSVAHAGLPRYNRVHSKSTAILVELKNTPVSDMSDKLNTITIEKMLPDFDRDLYVKAADVAAYTSGAVVKTYINKVDSSDAANPVLTERGTLDMTVYTIAGGNVSKAGTVLTDTFDIETNASDPADVKYKVAAKAGGEYIRIHIGESTSVLKAIADATLETMDDTIGSITIGQVMDIYPEDVYEEAADGTYAYVAGAYVAYEASMGDVTRYNLTHEKSTPILIELRNTGINDMSTAINDITIEKMMPDFDRDLYIKTADLALYAADNTHEIKTYVSKIDTTDEASPVLTERGVLNTAAYVITATDIKPLGGNVITDKYSLVDEDNTAAYEWSLTFDEVGTYIKVHVGTSSSVLKALADTTLNTMDSSVSSLKIGDVMDIYTEDVYEADDSGMYVKIAGEYVAYNSALHATEQRYTLVHEKSTPILIELRDSKIDEMSSKINDITIEKMMPDFDRDLYIKTADLALYAADNTHEIKTYVSRIDTTDEANPVLEERGVLNTAAYVITATDIKPVGGNVITDKYSLVDEDTTSAYEWTLSYDEAGEYIKIKVGTSSSVLKALADTTLNTMDSSVSGLKIGEVMDIYTEDVYEEADDGAYAFVAGEYVAYEASMGSVTRYNLVHEKSTPILIELRNSKIDEMSSQINDIALEKMIPDFDRDLFILAADLAAATDGDTLTAYTGKVESGAAIERGSITLDGVKYRKNVGGELERYDATASAWVAMTELYKINADGTKLLSDKTGTYVKAYEGTTSAVLKVLADTTLNSMDTSIKDMTLGEVVEIVEEDEYEVYDASNPDHAGYTRFYKRITVESNDYYVKWNSATDAESLRLVKVVERSSGMLVSLKNDKVTELSTKANEVMNSLQLNDVVEVDSDIYRPATPTEFAEIQASTYANAESVFYNDEDGSGIYISYDATTHASATNDQIYIRIYEGIDNAIMRKMAYVKVGDIGGKMTDVINDIALKDVITIVEKNVYSEDVAGSYAVLADVLASDAAEYYGTFETREYNDGTNDRVQILVKYHSGVTYASPTRYNISQEKSAAALVAMANVKVGQMGTDMQGVVDTLTVDRFISIDGDVFTKLTAVGAASTEEADWLTAYGVAQAEAGLGVQVYVNDDGMYRPVDPLFAENDAGIKDASMNGWYIRVYDGQSNAVIKKLAGVSIADMPNRIKDATNDCTLREIGIDTTEGSLLDTIADYRLSEMDTAVTSTLSGATLRQINEWGGLGLEASAITNLNKAKYINYCSTNSITPDPLYDGEDPEYDISAREFFSHISITGIDPMTGAPVIVFTW